MKSQHYSLLLFAALMALMVAPSFQDGSVETTGGGGGFRDRVKVKLVCIRSERNPINGKFVFIFKVIVINKLDVDIKDVVIVLKCGFRVDGCDTIRAGETREFSGRFETTDPSGNIGPAILEAKTCGRVSVRIREESEECRCEAIVVVKVIIKLICIRVERNPVNGKFVFIFKIIVINKLNVDLKDVVITLQCGFRVGGCDTIRAGETREFAGRYETSECSGDIGPAIIVANTCGPRPIRIREVSEERKCEVKVPGHGDKDDIRVKLICVKGERVSKDTFIFTFEVVIINQLEKDLEDVVIVLKEGLFVAKIDKIPGRSKRSVVGFFVTRDDNPELGPAIVSGKVRSDRFTVKSKEARCPQAVVCCRARGNDFPHDDEKCHDDDKHGHKE